MFYSAFLKSPIRNRNNPAIGDNSFQQALYPLLVGVAYGIAHDQAMALSHLIVLNSPLEDIGAYAFQRKPGFLLSDILLNKIAKFCIEISYLHLVIIVCH